MSRLANKPLTIPKGVTVKIDPNGLEVKGPKKTIQFKLVPNITISSENNVIHVSLAPGADEQEYSAMLGTIWANLKNTLQGVSDGFKLHLVLVGVGYRVQIQGHTLNFTLGLSHPVSFDLPSDVTAESPSQTELVLSSHDKQLVGQVAARIRKYRPPECYKGKGIKFLGEVLVLKEVKKK